MAEIPEPPPYPKPDEGAGEFGSDPGWTTIDDQLKEAVARDVANMAELLGHTDAARHMRHYLNASGTDLDVDPDRIMRDVQSFRDKVKRTVAGEIYGIAKKAPKGVEYEKPAEFVTKWLDAYLGQDETPNWFYALGGIRYSVTGVVIVHKPAKKGDRPEVGAEYRVHVWDRYNWDGGKSVTIGPVTIDDETLADLHLAGVAREYTVIGKSDVYRYSGPVPTEAEAGKLPDPPDDRSGDRSDPSRSAA